MEIMKKFKAFYARFAKAQRGNVAIIFGVMMVPTMVLIGGLVDYGMAIKTKSQLTATLDAAMLAAMLQYADDENVNYEQIIVNYINKNYTESGKKLHGVILDVATPVITDEGEMKGAITVRVRTNFLTFAHFDEFVFTVRSGVMVGGSSIEVSLVLDNTGSMKGAKIAALKSAANDLLDIIMPEDYDNSNEKIKFAVVPFADYVNIGTAHSEEPGLDIPAPYTVITQEAGEQCWNTYPNSTQVCTPNPRTWGTCSNDGVPYGCWKWAGETCTGDPGDPVEHCENQDAETRSYDWYGCVGSREDDLNVKDEGYDVGVPGLMYEWNWCAEIAPVTRLTPVRADIVAGLDAMVADDRKTYVPSGLMWGWRSLSSTAPFADGAPYGDAAVRKVIVLMSDGANTRTHWGKWNGQENHEDGSWWRKKLGWRALHNESDVYGHNGSWHAAERANAITETLCANIKEKNIMVYTIGFEIDENSDIENLMKACAGNGGQYYDADNSTELADAFKEIGKSLLNLRLTH